MRFLVELTEMLAESVLTPEIDWRVRGQRERHFGDSHYIVLLPYRGRLDSGYSR